MRLPGQCWGLAWGGSAETSRAPVQCVAFGRRENAQPAWTLKDTGCGPEPPPSSRQNQVSESLGGLAREAGLLHPEPRALLRCPHSLSADSRHRAGGNLVPVLAQPGHAARTPSLSPEHPLPSPTPLRQRWDGLRAWLSAHLGIAWLSLLPPGACSGGCSPSAASGSAPSVPRVTRILGCQMGCSATSLPPAGQPLCTPSLFVPEAQPPCRMGLRENQRCHQGLLLTQPHPTPCWSPWSAPS